MTTRIYAICLKIISPLKVVIGTVVDFIIEGITKDVTVGAVKSFCMIALVAAMVVQTTVHVTAAAISLVFMEFSSRAPFRITKFMRKGG